MGAGDLEKKKALAAALRENLKRRKAQAKGRRAEAGKDTEDPTIASQAGASATTSRPRND